MALQELKHRLPFFSKLAPYWPWYAALPLLLPEQFPVVLPLEATLATSFGVRSESTRVAWVLIGASVLCAHMSTALLPWFNLQSRGTILLPEHGNLFNLRPDFSPMVIACASPDPAPCLHRCCIHPVGTRDAGTIARKCTPFPSRKMLASEAPRAGSCNTLSTTLHT